jgi:hypothetical protein
MPYEELGLRYKNVPPFRTNVSGSPPELNIISVPCGTLVCVPFKETFPDITTLAVLTTGIPLGAAPPLATTGVLLPLTDIP